jgi:hypothetical protein
MKAALPPILLFGALDELLVTRKWVLESRGYRVVVVSRLSELPSVPRVPAASLLLFCGAVSPRAREAAIAFALSRWPGIRCHVLAMDGGAPAGLLGRLMHTADGPDRLTTLVAGLLNDGKPCGEEAA